MKRKIIRKFSGYYKFLSNFYPCFENEKTVEHFYQAAKATNHEDERKILEAKTPAQAKRLGKEIKIRKNWEYDKLKVMTALVKKKFENQELKQKLLQTGDATLVEGNIWHDNYWGDCYCSKCKDIKGLNKLGKIIMKIRTMN